jgi:hypothetical protein
MKRFQILAAVAVSLLLVSAASAQLTVTPSAGFNLSWQGSSTTPGASGPYDSNANPLVGDGSVNGPTPDLGLSSLGVTAFASSDFTNGITYPQHQISHLNDGVYGNSNSWIAGADASPAAGLDFGTRSALPAVSLSAFAFSRNEGGFTYGDRVTATYTVQYTDVKSSSAILAGMLTGDNYPNPPTSHSGTALAVTGNASTGWETIGTINYASTSPVGSFNPALFNQFAVSDSLGNALLGVTGFRLVGVTTNDTDIDELQVFGQATPEPSTFVLAGLGLVGLLIARRRRNK